MTASTIAPGGKEDIARLLHDSAEAMGLALSAEQSGQLLDYVGLLARWNRTYNLTAVREPAQVLTHHLLDCLAAVPPLCRTLRDRRSNRLLDVGSGAGLPGIVFAVVCPELVITCVESVGKKAAFIREAASVSRLRNLRIINQRVEAIASEPLDLVVSRAFSTLTKLVMLTDRLLVPDGLWMAMKGRVPDKELAELSPRVRTFHVEQLPIPGLDAERCLVWIEKTTSSDATEESVH